MVSVLPPTAAGAVCTVAGAALALAAGDPLAEATARPPPAAATARPIPAMMIFGCRIVISLWCRLLLLTRIVEICGSPPVGLFRPVAGGGGRGPGRGGRWGA